jgi:hypothetical protein
MAACEYRVYVLNAGLRTDQRSTHVHLSVRGCPAFRLSPQRGGSLLRGPALGPALHRTETTIRIRHRSATRISAGMHVLGQEGGLAHENAANVGEPLDFLHVRGDA